MMLMEQLIDRLLGVFSIEYIFTVIFATYFLIKLIEEIRGKKPVPTWIKKVSTISVGALTFWLFTQMTETPMETLLTSYFSALFFYDYVIKWLLKRFNVNYKK